MHCLGLSKRKISKTALGKRLFVDLAGTFPADPESPAREIVIRAWVGILSEGLVKVADDAGESPFCRMAAVENGLSEIRSMLQEALKGPAGMKEQAPVRGARSKVEAQPPGTVASARAAGVGEDAIGEMAQLIRSKKGRAGEPGLDAHGEADELEHQEVEDGENFEEPFEAEHPGGSRCPPTHQDRLEPCPDQEAAGSGQHLRSRRSSIIVRRKWFGRWQKECGEDAGGAAHSDLGVHQQADAKGLRNDARRPRESLLRTNMAVCPLQDHELPYACSLVMAASRASGQTDRARARASLMLAAADQASIDGGSWVMSTVALLEPLPPYQEFSKHATPGPAESQVSALYDARWAKIFLGALKERERERELQRSSKTTCPSRTHRATSTSTSRRRGSQRDPDKGPKGRGRGAKAKSKPGDGSGGAPES